MDLQTSSIGKQFTHYVSFNVLSMLGLSLYILADTYFVANGVGSEGLTALNLVIPIYNFINGLGLMFGMGGATLFSLLNGQGEQVQGGHVFTMTLIVTLLSGLLLLGIGYPLAYPLAELLGGQGAVLGYAGQYLEVNFLFAPFYLLNNLLACFVRNDGAPNRSMVSMLVGSFSNIVLDYVFVFPLQMGMFGAALATGFAPVLGVLILSGHFLRRRRRFFAPLSGLRFRQFARVLSLGVPSLLNELSSGTVILVFNLVILGIAGNTGVAAYGIIANIALIAIAVFTGVAQGIQPLVSHHYGAGQKRHTFQLLRLACVTALGFGMLFYLAGLLFPDAITALFNRENDPSLAAFARDGIRIYFSSFLFAGLNIVMISFFSSVGRAAPSFALSLCRGFVFVLLALALLAPVFGLAGVWWSVPLAEIAACLFSFGMLIFIRRVWKKEEALSR
ncbi:MAG: MATE family efflux transporter [Oscillospiraceae bacterium]|jgi:putative MATE family efflux protein